MPFHSTSKESKTEVIVSQMYSVSVNERRNEAGLSMNILHVGNKSPMQRGFSQKVQAIYCPS